MTDRQSEAKMRQEILTLVEQYAANFHENKEPYKAGERIPYASRVYDRAEMRNLVDASLDFWLTAGRYAAQFETDFGKYLGVPYVSLVNSGSSANLLAFMALTSPMLGEKRVLPGDEVITVACGFPTTVAPIIQYGAVPVFCDVTIPNTNIDVTQLEAAYSKKTKAVMLAHTLGNPFDIKAVKTFCDDHGLFLIEDNCDALGSKYTLDGKENFTGTFGDLATSSFYPPHHLTMGEGGAVYTKDPLLHRIVRSLRDWGRDCVCPPGQDNYCGHRFDGQYGELPQGYDHKYVYSHFGYNLKVTEMQAAVGVAQLAKFSGFAEARRKNHAFLQEALADMTDVFILPEATEYADPCWFGFFLTCKDGVDRNAIVQSVEADGVQTRMLFAGNLLRHPALAKDAALQGRFRVAGDLENTDRIMEQSFWVGVYPGMDADRLSAMADALHKAGGKA